MVGHACYRSEIPAWARLFFQKTSCHLNILKYPQYFRQIHKLTRDYFSYWIGKFDGIKLKPAAEINISIVEIQSVVDMKESNEDKRLQLRNMMGGLEQDINAMRIGK